LILVAILTVTATTRLLRYFGPYWQHSHHVDQIPTDAINETEDRVANLSMASTAATLYSIPSPAAFRCASAYRHTTKRCALCDPLDIDIEFILGFWHLLLIQVQVQVQVVGLPDQEQCF
jgi:hypothetical protein